MLSRPLVSGLVLLLALVASSLAAQFPCTYTSTTAKNYDLSNAWRDPSKGQAEYQTVFTDGSTFFVNICGQSAQNCNAANGVCQVVPGAPPSYYGNGNAASAQWADLPSQVDGVQITYPTGSGASCPGNVQRKSILMIKCDSGAGDGTIDSMTESTTPPCTYTINMRSKWACPVKPGKTNTGGGGGGGLSAGSIILITVACLVVVYFPVAALVKWKFFGADPRSLEIVPHAEFFMDLPFLVKDGAVYAVRKISCNRVCGEYSEI